MGVVNTLADVAVFAALNHFAHWPAVLANISSYSTAICLSFVLNRHITFRQRTHSHRTLPQFIRFVMVNLIALVLSTAQIAFFIQFLHALAAKLLSIPITFAWGFFGARRFVFPAPGRKESIAA